MEESPERKYFDHKVPSWVDGDTQHPTFFITVCCFERGTNQLALEKIWAGLKGALDDYEQKGDLNCPLFLAMPDHVHGILRFEGERTMEAVMRGWKRWTSRQLGIKWQTGFFEHRLRSQESAFEKRNYILKNPVRAALVKSAEEWPFVTQRQCEDW